LAYTTYTTTSNRPADYNPDYKKQYDAARQLVEGRYQQAENKSQEEYSALQPAYQKERDAISQQAAQTGRQMENYYANRGLDRSGSMVGARANIANTGQQGINNINQQQQLARQQLTNRLAELRQGRATDLAALEGREGQDLRNFDLQLAQMLGNYGGQQTLAGQSTALQNALAEAGVTGMYQGKQTLPAQQQALQQALAEAGITGTYKGQQTLPAQQQTWQQQYYQNQANQAYMGMLLDLINAQAQQTGSWTMPKNFTYGDALNALLQKYKTGVY
jgi:hypothetical protein